MAMAIHFIFKILDLAIRLKKWPFVFLAIRLPGVTYHPKLWEPEIIFENDTSGFMTNLWLILESIGII